MDDSRKSVTAGARGELALTGAQRPAPHLTRRPRTEFPPATRRHRRVALARAALTCVLALAALATPAFAQDTTPPTLTSTIVTQSGQKISLGFPESLQQSNLPPASAFTVTVDGSPGTVSGVNPDTVFPTGFSISVSPVIRQGQAVVVTYTAPTAGDDAIQDAAGNDAASFTTGMNGVPAVTNSSTVAATVPGAPTTLSATAGGNPRINLSGRIKLSWTAPASDGGSAITGYKIEVSSDGGSNWSDRVANTGDAKTTYSHNGLAAGTTRHYRVSAINTNGTGDASNTANATTYTTVPGDPTNLSATADGTTQINLSWTAPASNGGAAIITYGIHVSPDGKTDWRTRAGNPNTTYSQIGLAPGTTRYYRVSAANATGVGGRSNTASATTGQATVTFGASLYTAVEGGAAATVEVQLSAALSAPVTIPLEVTHLGTATAADHSGIPPNVTFEANQTAITFTVTATADTDAETGEGVSIGFGTLPEGVFAWSPATATVTLADRSGPGPGPGPGPTDSDPTVTISTTASAPVTGPFTVTVVFSESVNGFELPDLVVGNGGASDLQGNGTTFTATITPAASGTVTVDVPAGAAEDDAGNESEAASRLSIAAELDTTAPSVTISTAASAPVNVPFTVTFTFSEEVTGFELTDLVVGNGSSSALQGDGASYTATITPEASGTVTVDVPAGAASDDAGNPSVAARQFSIAADTMAPTVTIAGPATEPVIGPFSITVIFSEPVTGFALEDLVVGNGVASELEGDGARHAATVTPTASGPVTVGIAAGAAEDSAGNPSTAADRFSITAELTPVPALPLAGVIALAALLLIGVIRRRAGDQWVNVR